MKLTDLEPHWCLGGQWNESDGTQHFVLYDQSFKRHGMGLTFLCPVHREHRLAIMFENPLDGLPPDVRATYRWQRTGETFETLTLGPSIDASGNLDGEGAIKTPCWHGFIRNGEIQ